MSAENVDHAITFRQQLQEAVKQSRFDSNAALSVAAGLSENAIGRMLKGQFDHSQVGPGLFSVKRIADALGKPIGYLFREQHHISPADKGVFNALPKEGNIDVFTEAHWKSGGRLAAFDHLSEFYDLYAVPTDDQSEPRILRLGPRGLYSMRLQSTDIDLAQAEINELSVEMKEEVLQFHRRVVRDEIAMQNTFLNHRLKHRPLHVRAGYCRLGMLVTDGRGTQVILIYCLPIPV